MFRALPVTGNDRNTYHATISTFAYVLKKSLGEYLVWGGRDWAPRFDHWKKKTRQWRKRRQVKITNFKFPYSVNNRAVQQLIDLLISDDPEVDDLREAEVPQEVEEKLKVRDQEEEKEIENFQKEADKENTLWFLF